MLKLKIKVYEEIISQDIFEIAKITADKSNEIEWIRGTPYAIFYV